MGPAVLPACLCVSVKHPHSPRYDKTVLPSFVQVLLLTLAQSTWPEQLRIDVESKSWEAAARVGAAIVEEVQKGRLYPTFADVPEEIKTRNLYADALDHIANSAEATRQRTIARLLESNPDAPEVRSETGRRTANLKQELLSTQLREPSTLPHSDRVTIVAFWADWCAICKPELDRLSRYRNPQARVVTIDADHLDTALRPYLKIESLQSPELPQLYVVDPSGNIRFHLNGYEDDLFFEKKLDWMIEAALR